MTNEQFELLIKARLERTSELLSVKQKEYAREDRLHNFKRLSELQRAVPESSLIKLCDKQYVSIHDMVDDIEDGMREIDSERLDLFKEKIGDVIAYMMLLECLVWEREKLPF